MRLARLAPGKHPDFVDRVVEFRVIGEKDGRFCSSYGCGHFLLRFDVGIEILDGRGEIEGRASGIRHVQRFAAVLHREEHGQRPRRMSGRGDDRYGCVSERDLLASSATMSRLGFPPGYPLTDLSMASQSGPPMTIREPKRSCIYFAPPT